MQTEGKFIIKNGKVIPENDLIKWSMWLGSKEGRKDRRIGMTKLSKYHVSTVFLGIDYSFRPGGVPILFETMVFENKKKINEGPIGGKFEYHSSLEDYTERYSTLEEAKAGHKRIVREVKKLK